MKIFIIMMDEPIETNGFIQRIIEERKEDIIGLAVSRGDRLKLSKGKSKAEYLVSLFLIMGPIYFLSNVTRTLWFKCRKYLATNGLGSNPSILAYAQDLGIAIYEIKTPNSKSFQRELRRLQPDVIINQSQSIIKKQLLEIPTIGVINRHNALLPRNRGRLTPFWVLYRGESETGVSIHFVEEGIDSGEIIVQKRFPVSKSETFRSLVKKNYQIAPVAMLEALERLEEGEKDYIENPDELATYNTTPTLKDAWKYRIDYFKRLIK